MIADPRPQILSAARFRTLVGGDPDVKQLSPIVFKPIIRRHRLWPAPEEPEVDPGSSGDGSLRAKRMSAPNGTSEIDFDVLEFELHSANVLSPNETSPLLDVEMDMLRSLFWVYPQRPRLFNGLLSLIDYSIQTIYYQTAYNRPTGAHMFIRAYLRASTEDQDATRAKQQLQVFAKERGLRVAGFYIENVSGASLQRPELFRLLADSEPGDVLLLEQVDRLSRLTSGDWEKLKAEIKAKGVRVVALDLPTSWAMLSATPDDFTARMFSAINDMLLDMLAAIARKDYDDRRRRQAQGIENAKAKGLYNGRPENTEKNAAIMTLLQEGKTWRQIQAMVPVSKATLAKLSKRASPT